MDAFTESLLRRITTITVELENIKSTLIGGPASTNDNKLYEKKEAANYLSVSYRTINRWIEQGLLRGKYVGKRYKISAEELRRFAYERSDESGITKKRASEPMSIDDIRDKYSRQLGALR